MKLYPFLFPLAVSSLAVGCDVKPDVPPPLPSKTRSDAVAAKEVSSALPTASAHVPTPQAPARQLCAGQTPRPAPKGAVKTASAAGVDPPKTPVPFGVGRWTWVNLWAAWCGPCKEEMPRLLAWQGKLAASGVSLDLAFVSLDDDARQLQRFLDAQPSQGGVRASYWLPDGDLRPPWLAALGVKDSPTLPVQALVSPAGQVACVIPGAVEDRDYTAIAAFVGARAP